VYIATKDTKQEDEFYGDYNAEFFLARRLNQIGCPNVVEIYDYGVYTTWTAEKFFRIAMEYCSYGSLEDLIEFYKTHNLAMPEPFIWYVVRELASALTYCHNGGLQQNKAPNWEPIAHMDLKPLNVLLQAGPRARYPLIKLADFGLSMALPNQQIAKYKSSNDVGTPGYTDPHDIFVDFNGAVILRPRTLKTDIYSLGKVLDDLIQTIIPDITRHYAPVMYSNSSRLLRYNLDQYCPCRYALLSLMTRCVDAEPNNRPDAWDVYQIADQELKKPAMVAELANRQTGFVLANGYRQRSSVLKRRIIYYMSTSRPETTGIRKISTFWTIYSERREDSIAEMLEQLQHKRLPRPRQDQTHRQQILNH